MLDLTRPEIETLFDLDAGAQAVRAAYVAQAEGRVQTPDITHLDFPQARGECHVKTGYIQGSAGFVIKIATGFYHNPEKGLPSSNGMNLLFSAETGQTLALLRDEGWLTDIRTGLGGALATQALMRPDSQKVLIVGGGLQARHQARCLFHLFPAKDMEFVIWARNPRQADSTAEELRTMGLKTRSATDLRQACGVADAIITTTPTKTPLIQAGWIRPGTHVTAIGADSPGKQELDSQLVLSADLRLCDLQSQSLEHGEFQTVHAAGDLTTSDVISLGQVLSGSHPGRTSDNQITIADLTGLAAQDAAASLVVYTAALANRSQDTAHDQSN